jgi:stage IV sporulation protein FB
MEFALTYISMVFHELGHALAAKTLGKKVYSINILPVGLNAAIEEFSCSRPERIIIYTSGPLINILSALFFHVIGGGAFCKSDSIMCFLATVNYLLAIFNLLPTLPLDGGKIYRDLLTVRLGLISANRKIQKISIWVSLLLILLGIVQLTGNIFNFTLILIGLYLLFLIKIKKSEAAVMNVKDVIYRRSRLLKKGIYPARDLVVVKSMRLGDIIKCLDFDRFHIIHVLNEELKLVNIFTEQDIIDAVFKYSMDLTFEEFMGKLK